MEQVREKTFEFLEEHLEEQALLFTKERCQNIINSICNKASETIEEYNQSLNGLSEKVNPNEEYNMVLNELKKIIEDKDYLAALKVINNKGLLPYTNLTNEFGWKKQYYIDYVIKLMESKDCISKDLCDVFRKYIPVPVEIDSTGE